jgi:sugar phosphate isomerase/epimerase
MYGTRIDNIHIKDRKKSGGSVRLGTGDADFKQLFRLVKDIGYKGSFTLQTAREKDDIDAAERNLKFVKKGLGMV